MCQGREKSFFMNKSLSNKGFAGVRQFEKKFLSLETSISEKRFCTIWRKKSKKAVFDPEIRVR